jgi:RNA-directed DNA polymerase
MMSIVEELARQHSLNIADLRRFCEFAPHRYKIYTIPKRSVGHRVIAHPSKKLKEFQRSLNDILLKTLPVHERVYSYRKNKSIRNNAFEHLESSYLLKMDFKDYFMSITPQLFWEKVNPLNIIENSDEKKIIERLLFWCPSKRLSGKLVLSVGAPTSPLISNFIAFDFDKEINRLCRESGITYTRYSDDLTFTTFHKSILFSIPKLVSSLLKETMSGSVSINESKTVYASKASNRHVTGITLTSDGRLSVGRDRKRYISSLIHKFSQGSLPRDEFSHAQGLFTFATFIEPDFRKRMEYKYTENTISNFLNNGGDPNGK